MGWCLWTEEDGKTKHLIPTGENERHSRYDCWCKPSYEVIPSGNAYVHRSNGRNRLDETPLSGLKPPPDDEDIDGNCD